MAILKEDKHYTALCSLEGLTAWIKHATYKSTLNNIEDVITELVITKEGTKEIVYKNVSSNWICYYNKADGLSITDIIEDVLIFVANYDKGSYYMNKFINEALNNSSTALIVIKRFIKEHNEHIKELKIIENNKILTIELSRLKNEVDIVIKTINNYTKIRYNKPTQINKYTHEFYTEKSIKRFKSGASLKEDIEIHKSILNFLKQYLNYLENDFIPELFLKFDAVV